jgi:hypothetical protein
MRTACPANEPSPKKFPSPKMPMVASLPTLDTTVSPNLSFLNIENSVSRIPLREDAPFLDNSQALSPRTNGREENSRVKATVLLGCGYGTHEDQL